MAQIMTIDGLRKNKVIRQCIRKKRTRAGLRCAKYKIITRDEFSEFAGPKKTCQLYTYTKQKGNPNPILRCAEMRNVRGIPSGEIESIRKKPYHYWHPKGIYKKINAKLLKIKNKLRR